ncbi:unnamed protein product [Nezara viridula]|uniref:Uncharacterized protein n=1 Tax=Nezara viridula TaxID=85310 RepID=A0A9P0HK89_NEZVI|nr:unnamed protein product [Nezara viridula]
MSASPLYQKRLRKERKARRRLQDQLELEMKRRSQLEEALKAAGAPPEALRTKKETRLRFGGGTIIEIDPTEEVYVPGRRGLGTAPNVED